MALNSNKARRRFLPIEKYPVYNNIFDFLKLHSPVFNERSRTIDNAFRYSDLSGLQGEIIRYEGNQDKDSDLYNKYIDPETEEILPCVIAMREETIKIIETKFKIHQQKEINQGREKPEKMPLDILNEYYRACASLDVAKLELMVLKDNLETIQMQREDPGKKSFKMGRCTGKQHGGVLIMLDGQKCAKDPKVTIRIKDEKSPFNGLKAYEYSRLNLEWRKANIRLNKRLNKIYNLHNVPGNQRRKGSLQNPCPIPEYVTERYNWETEKMEEVKGVKIDWNEMIEKRLNELIKK